MPSQEFIDIFYWGMPGSWLSVNQKGWPFNEGLPAEYIVVFTVVADGKAEQVFKPLLGAFNAGMSRVPNIANA